MLRGQRLAFGVLIVVALTIAFTMVVRGREGRCRFDAPGKWRLDCSYAPGTFGRLKP